MSEDVGLQAKDTGANPVPATTILDNWEMSLEVAEELMKYRLPRTSIKKAKQHLLNLLPTGGRVQTPIQYKFDGNAGEILESCLGKVDDRSLRLWIRGLAPLLINAPRESRDANGSLYKYLYTEHPPESDEQRTWLGVISRREARAWREQQNPSQVELEWLVTSVNPLDMLLVSDHADYKSCYNLQGDFKAGAYQIMCDPHTVVLYVYRNLSLWRDITLPFKEFRQIGIIQHHTGFIRRAYGHVTQSRTYEVRRSVGHLLGASHWTTTTNVDTVDVIAGRAGYMDELASRVTVRGCTPEDPVQLMQPGCLKCMAAEVSTPYSYLCEFCIEGIDRDGEDEDDPGEGENEE